MRRLWVVAVDNEVKEVLYELGQEPAVDPERHALNLRRDGSQQEFRLNRAREARAIPRYAEAQQYLYEPNAAVLKAGAFRSIGTAFELLKLHQHSHLYTSDLLRTDFPGRVFRIRAVEKADGPTLKAHLGPEARAHVTTRNFPDSVADFRRRTGIREGGDSVFVCHHRPARPARGAGVRENPAARRRRRGGLAPETARTVPITMHPRLPG